MKRPDDFDRFMAVRAIGWGIVLFLALLAMWWTK